MKKIISHKTCLLKNYNLWTTKTWVEKFIVCCLQESLLMHKDDCLKAKECLFPASCYLQPHYRYSDLEVRG